MPEALRGRTPTRAAFVLLASQQGWHDPDELARCCGVTRRAIYHGRGRHEPALVAAAALCLGDDRLLRPWSDAARTVAVHEHEPPAAPRLEEPVSVAFPR